jgi:hypothetical protein
MKTVAVTTLLLVLAGVSALAKDSKGATNNETGVSQQIKQMEQQLRSEVVKGNTASMGRFEADNYVSVVGSGLMMDKNQSIKAIEDGSVKYSAIDVKEEMVRTYGNTAIYNGLASTKLTVNGDDKSGDYRVTIVWAKLNGEWKRVSFQATPVMSQTAR